MSGRGRVVVLLNFPWFGVASKTLHSCQIQYSPEEKNKIKKFKKLKARIANSPKKKYYLKFFYYKIYALFIYLLLAIIIVDYAAFDHV